MRFSTLSCGLILTTIGMSFGDDCPGCRSGTENNGVDCYQMTSDDAVYACRGTFTGGMLGTGAGSAEYVCSEGYHVCTSASEVADLGLTYDQCSTIPGENEVFFSQESSRYSGNLQCQTDHYVDSEAYNDVWGCTSSATRLYPSGTCYIEGRDNDAICGGVLNMACGNGDTVGWTVGSDSRRELISFAVIDETYGGVLCCEDETGFECISQDVIFAMDESGSIDNTELSAERTFVNGLIDKIDPESHIGVVAFESSARDIYDIDASQDRTVIKNVVSTFSRSSGGTSFIVAIDQAISMFNRHGDNDLPDVFVLVTDGQASGHCDKKTELDNLGITPVIVGIGSGFTQSNVECLVDDPDSQIVHAASFLDEDLQTIVDMVANTICNVGQCKIVTELECEECTCDDLTNCAECGDGYCSSCDEGYFLPSFYNEYQCGQCQETFGDECLSCADYVGCTKCDYGYEIVFIEECNLYGCEVESCIVDVCDSVVDSSQDIDESGCPIPCETSPCSCDDLCFCDVCHENGCNQCLDGYFKKDYNYPCVQCQEIFGDGCMFCQDFDGCGQCSSAYERVYNHDCGLWECQ